jgi:hypothetical protein
MHDPTRCAILSAMVFGGSWFGCGGWSFLAVSGQWRGVTVPENGSNFHEPKSPFLFLS